MDSSLVLVLLVFGIMLLTIGGGLWIALAIGIAGFTVLLAFAGPALLSTMGMSTFNAINSFTLTALPLFIFMGEILLHSGFGKRLYNGASAWIGHLPGGLLHSNIAACAIFAAISGSSVATAATMGTVAIPEQEARGYDRKLVYGSLAAGGTLGTLIPPSILFILYGFVMQVSVGQLFMAGVIPGVMMSVLFMTYIFIRAKINPRLGPPAETVSWRGRLVSLAGMWQPGLLIFLVLGGIYLGVTTPTEAAAVGSCAAMLLALVSRRLTWNILRISLVAAVRLTCMIMFIIVGAHVITVTLAYLNVPANLTRLILETGLPNLVIFSVIIFVYFILGCFLEGIALLLLTAPIVAPIMVGFGYDLIWFGVMLVILIEQGQLTPPLGMNLFVIHGVVQSINPGRPLSEVILGTAPFFCLQFVAIVILTAWPQIALWLPRHVLG